MSEPVGREIRQGQRIVPTSLIQQDPYKCPHCGSTSITLQGYFKRTFEQVYADGKGDADGLTLGQSSLQEITGILCSACKIQTYVEEDVSFERDMMIFDLQVEVATLHGRVVAPSGKEWKN